MPPLKKSWTNQFENTNLIDTPSKNWNGQRQAILGSAADEGTIAFLQNQIRAIDGVPARLQAVYEERKSLTKRIYRALKRQVAVLVDLYSPVQGFISSHKEIGTKFDLNFSVSLQNIGFEDTFLEWINSSKSGPFIPGLQEGRKTLQDLVSWRCFRQRGGSHFFYRSSHREAKRRRC